MTALPHGISQTLQTTRDQSFRDAAGEVNVIAVMGVTGSGKSTFIRKASGLDDVEVGEGLASCTEKPKLYEFTHEGREFVLIDTPGFDDTFRTDADVLKDVATCLAFTYKINMELTGIVYLHRIIDPRITHGGMRNLAMFRKLCGNDPLKNVVLATTHWSEVPPSKGALREQELQTKTEYWGEMLAKESQMVRFGDTRDSALAILLSLAGKQRVALDIQKEMVDQGLAVSDTAAGEALNKEIAEIVKMHDGKMKKLRQEMQEAIEARDVELQETLATQTRDTEKQLKVMYEQQEALKADRRNEMRRLELEWDRRLRRIQRENEVRESEQQALEQKLNQERAEADEQIKRLTASLQSARIEDRESYLRRIQELNSKKPSKGGRAVRIIGAFGYTLSAGMCAMNPLAIPSAISSFTELVNSIFSSSGGDFDVDGFSF